MRKFSIGLIFLLLFFSCVPAGQKKVLNQEKVQDKKIEFNEAKKRYKDADEYAKKLRNNPDIYFGEGVANIGSDIGLCKEKARKSALKYLAEHIEVKVESDVKVIINKNFQKSSSDYNSEIEKRFNEKLKIYTSQVLTDIHESKLFPDYPRKGDATYFVYIYKKDYEEKVKKDLNQKKNYIISNIKNGDENFNKGNYVLAIKDYVNAEKMKKSFFSNIPVYEDINSTGNKIELSHLVKNKITDFFSKIELSLLNNDFQYSPKGKLSKNPEIYAQYIDKNNEKHIVKGLPLTIEVIKGKLQSRPFVTGLYGEAELNIINLDPSFRETLLKVAVDREKITGEKPDEVLNNSSIKIKLVRKKTIAVAAVFFNNGKKYLPKNIKDHIQSFALERGFGVVDISYEESLKNDFPNLNADFLLVVKINSSKGKSAGNYANMFISNCSASISLYSLPSKNLAARENTGLKKGFGVSSDSAGWDGFGKNRAEIISKSDSVIGAIK